MSASRVLLLGAVVFVLSALPSTAQALPNLTVKIVNQRTEKVFVTLSSASGSSSTDGRLRNNVPVALTAIPGGTFQLPRSVASGRIYFGLGKGVTNGVPPTSQTRFDKVELSTIADGVADLTSIDFFGLPIRMATYNAKKKVLAKANEPYGDVMIAALKKIPGSRSALVKSKRTGAFLRYLGPGLDPNAYPSLDPYVKSMVGKPIRLKAAFDGSPFALMDYSGTIGRDGSLALTGTSQTTASPKPTPDLPITIAAGDLNSKAIYSAVGKWRQGGKRITGKNQPNNRYTVIYRDLLAGFDLGYWNGEGTSRYRKPAVNDTDAFCAKLIPAPPPIDGSYCPAFSRPPFARARTRQPRFAAYDEYAATINRLSDSYGFPYSDTGSSHVQLHLDPARMLKITLLPDKKGH